jgi:hypothetical protein
MTISKANGPSIGINGSTRAASPVYPLEIFVIVVKGDDASSLKKNNFIIFNFAM